MSAMLFECCGCATWLGFADGNDRRVQKLLRRLGWRQVFDGVLRMRHWCCPSCIQKRRKGAGQPAQEARQ